MSREHIINRFDFDTICGGILYAIQRPIIFGKISGYLDPEWLFQQQASEPKVAALREIAKVANIVFKDPDTKDLFNETSIKTQIRKQNIDMAKGDAYVGQFDAWLHDHKIKALSNNETAFDCLVDYLKSIQFAKGSKELSNSYQLGDIKKAIEAMNKIIGQIAKLSDSVTNTTVDLRPDALLAFLKKNSEKHRSITEKLLMGANTELDEKIGGFEKQTLNLFIGATGGGKSMMCHHLLRRCIEQSFTVHLFCVEDRWESFMYKYIACQTGIPMHRVKQFDQLSKEETTSVKVCLDNLEKYVIVDFYYGRSVDEIHQKSLEIDMDRRNRGKVVPTVHIVDYTGHIAAFSDGDKTFEKMRNAYASRKNFALKNNKICFDFAQINRSGGNRMREDNIISHNDLAGAFDLSQVCDNIITINRGPQEMSSKEAILHIAKSRDGETGGKIRVKTQFECARYDMEKPEAEPVRNPEDHRYNRGLT